jgi:hypothetical protein
MTLHLLKVHLQTFLSIPISQKWHILSCDTLVANERYSARIHYILLANLIIRVNRHWHLGIVRKRHALGLSVVLISIFILSFGWYPGVWILYARKNYSILPAYNVYEDGTECSETSVYKIQTPRHHLKEVIQHSEKSEILISRIISICSTQIYNMEFMLAQPHS